MKDRKLKEVLREVVVTRKNIESLMSTLEIKDVPLLFDTNPVFWDGCQRDPTDNDVLFDLERFNHLLDMLSKTHTHLLRAQELMLRLGIQHVRLEVGTGLSQKMEESN